MILNAMSLWFLLMSFSMRMFFLLPNQIHSIFETKSGFLWWRLDTDTLCWQGDFTHCFTNCPYNGAASASSRNRSSNWVSSLSASKKQRLKQSFRLHPLVIHHQLNRVSNNKLLKWLQLKFRNQNKLRLRTLVKVNMTSQDRISCRTAFSTSQLQHPIDTSHVFSNFFIVSENWFRYITVPSVFRG